MGIFIKLMAIYNGSILFWSLVYVLNMLKWILIQGFSCWGTVEETKIVEN